MGNDEAEELGRFRRNLEGIDDRALLAIVAGVVDDAVGLLRAVPGGARLPIEMAAAVAAELHRRTQPTPAAVRAPKVGHA